MADNRYPGDDWDTGKKSSSDDYLELLGLLDDNSDIDFNSNSPKGSFDTYGLAAVCEYQYDSADGH